MPLASTPPETFQSPMHAPTSSRPATSKSRKAFWLKQLHMWHWMSSAVSLIGLLLFAVTGFTLNHASWIGAKPDVTTRTAELPATLLSQLQHAWESDGDEKAALLRMNMEMLKRAVNVGFSGGEKKRAEMVQMGIIGPRFAVLDETDSGLDIDALRIVGEGINRIMRAPDKGVLLITHYERLLEYVRPDAVHVLQAGRITRSGDIELARDLEREGYAEAAA